MNFKQRREEILGIFTSAKASMEELNTEIESCIQSNNAVIADKMNENKELELLKMDNSNSIKAFGKFLKAKA